MHSIAELGTNVSAFLGKLWKIVEDPVTNDLISWSSTGTSFVIKDEIRFARELLPMYYKHNNMASFIRQLNMYGFHKIVSPESGSMKMEIQEEIQFTHPFFMQGHPYLLENIKRKIGVSKVVPGQLGEKNPQVMNKVLTDVRQMKGRQESMDSRLTAMKLENSALWRELSVLRQKHLKQQQIVNKLIQFLVTIVQQNHNSFSVKRKFPRMLQHYVRSPKKEIVNEDDLQEDASTSSQSPMGPVIHELDPAEALLETVVEEANNVDSCEPEYFLSQSSADDGMIPVIVNEEMPQSIKMYRSNSPSTETIIGMPHDTLTFSNGKPGMNYIVTERPREADLLRPKYIKLVNRKPKQYELSQQQKQTIMKESASSKDYPHSNYKLAIKPENLQRSSKISKPKRPQKIKKLTIPQEKLQSQQLQNNIQQRIRKVQPQIQENQQQKLNIDQMNKANKNKTKNNYKNNKHSLIKKDKPDSNTTPDQLQLSTESLLTIPFDNGVNGELLTEVESDPMYLDSKNVALTSPMVVEVPPEAVCASMVLQDGLNGQDVLLSSPVVVSKASSTPQPQPFPSLISPSVAVAIPGTASSHSPSPEAKANMQVACMSSDDPKVTSPSPVTRSAYSLNEFDSHLENLQSDLDNLKELLRSEGISLDANALLGYFNDDPLSYNISDPVCGDQTKENLGNELITYNPSVLDLTDLLGNEWSLPTSPSEQLPLDDTFSEVNTPQFIPQSPTFPPSAKKRRK